MDRGAWGTTVHWIAKNWIELSYQHFHFHGIREHSDFILSYVAVQFPSASYWIDCLFSIVCFCLLCKRSGDHRRMSFFSLGFLSFFFFFLFIFISWRLITLQYCSGFCHTLTWISHGFTCVPHPNPPSCLPLHFIPLGFLSCSIDQHFSFCASTIVLWSLELCSIVWSQGCLIPLALFFFLKISLAVGSSMFPYKL